MDRQVLTESANEYLSTSQLNSISKETALSEELISVKIFDEPVIGITDAENPMFCDLKSNKIIGEHFMLPTEWLVEAKSVVSFFFPFTEAIRSGNRANMDYPSKGWLHGRMEGQLFINEFARMIIDRFQANGFQTISPALDKRFFSTSGQDTKRIDKLYTSNWSERHVAYVCGLGTFGLSKGIITEKGMAGRLTSIITEQPLPADVKEMRRFEENCIKCGKCAKNCPVNAISIEHGKNHEACSKFLDTVLSENNPRYGCGKCQVGVPCEDKNPKKK